MVSPPLSTSVEHNGPQPLPLNSMPFFFYLSLMLSTVIFISSVTANKEASLQNAINIHHSLLSTIKFSMEDPQIRRTSTDCNSPEFEFWMLRNPSFPQPNLLSADELFVDGVLLPLHLLPTAAPTPNKPDPPPPPHEEGVHDPDHESGSTPAITDPAPSTLSSSKRWKDIFRKSEKKNTESNNPEEKRKKKERKSGSGASSAELNINIWPFSRSRSAGNAATRPKLFAGAPVTRKVNSAPCSRSNSAGESKSRKWPSSPGRPGIQLGRSSPVWQVRRGKNSEPNAEKVSKRETPTTRRSKLSTGGGSAKAKVLNLNVPMCIGYRHHLSCRSDENSAVGVRSAAVGDGGASFRRGECSDGGSGGNNLFNLRNLFTKKNTVTSH